MQGCPEPETLERLLLGQLEPEVADALEQHFETCSVCVQLAAASTRQDDLVAAMRGGGANATAPESTTDLRHLIQRVRDLQAETLTLQKDDTASIQAAITASEGLLNFELPGYTIERQLGEGGMGVVLQAYDNTLKRPVAIKLMKPSIATDVTARQRFLREAQAMAALNHDNVAKIFHVSDGQEAPFLAMELLAGESLQDRLGREHSFALIDVLQLGRQLAEGIAAAHATGLCHRDIKPSNVWLEQDTDRVKVLDFGLAHWSEQDSNLTQSGIVVGTPRYMAPEQAKGESVDQRADLFSIGVVLYQMLTGRLPFQGNNIAATLLAVVNHHPPTVHELNPAIPIVLSNTVDELLIKEPSQRLDSAAELAKRLATLEFQLAEADLESQIPVAAVATTPWWRLSIACATVAIVALFALARSQKPAAAPMAAENARQAGIALIERASKGLLDEIDLETAVRSGNWTRDATTGDLVCEVERGGLEEIGDAQARLVVPRRIAASYRVTMDFIWRNTNGLREGTGGVGINLPVGTNCVSLGISRNNHASLGYIDQVPGMMNSTATSFAPIVPGDGHRVEATVLVADSQAEIRIAINGDEGIVWSGPVSSVSNGLAWFGGMNTYRTDLGISVSAPTSSKDTISVRILDLQVEEIAIPLRLAVETASHRARRSDTPGAKPAWPQSSGLVAYAAFGIGKWQAIVLPDELIAQWKAGAGDKQIMRRKQGGLELKGSASKGLRLPDIELDNVLFRVRATAVNPAAGDFLGIGVRSSDAKGKLCQWRPAGSVSLGNDIRGRWTQLARKEFAEPHTGECEIVVAAIHGQTICYINGQQVLSYTQPFRDPGSLKLTAHGHFLVNKIEMMPLDELSKDVPRIVVPRDEQATPRAVNDYDVLTTGEWQQVVWRDEMLEVMRELDGDRHTLTRLADGSLEVTGAGPAGWWIEDTERTNVLVRASVVQVDGIAAVGLRGFADLDGPTETNSEMRYRIEANNIAGAVNFWDANIKAWALAHRRYRPDQGEYELAVAAIDDIISVFINGRHAMEYQSADVTPGLVMIGCNGSTTFTNVELMVLD